MTEATAVSTEGTTEDPALFGRSAGLLSSLGKCTERISADVPDALYEAVTRRRLALKMGEAEYLRFVLMRDAMGPDVLRRMYQEQIEVLLGPGPEGVV